MPFCVLSSHVALNWSRNFFFFGNEVNLSLNSIKGLLPQHKFIEKEIVPFCRTVLETHT